MRKILPLLFFFFILIALPTLVEGGMVGSTISINEKAPSGNAGEVIEVSFFLANANSKSHRDVFVDFSIANLDRQGEIDLKKEWIENIQVEPPKRHITVNGSGENANLFLPNLVNYVVRGRGLENPPNTAKKILNHSQAENINEIKNIYSKYVDTYIDEGHNRFFTIENILKAKELEDGIIPEEIREEFQKKGRELKNPKINQIRTGKWKISTENYYYYLEEDGNTWKMLRNVQDFNLIGQSLENNEIPSIIKDELDSENIKIENKKIQKSESGGKWRIRGEEKNLFIKLEEAARRITIEEQALIEINVHEWKPARELKVKIHTTRELPRGKYNVSGSFLHIPASQGGSGSGASTQFLIGHATNFSIKGREPPIPIWATILIIILVIIIGIILTIILRRRDIEI